MPILVTQVSTVVIRNGKRVSPPIGKPFNYTDQEVQVILKAKPLGLRKPVNETAEPVEVKEEELLDDGETEMDADDATDEDAEDEPNSDAPAKPANKAKNAAKNAAKKPKADKPADDDEDDDI